MNYCLAIDIGASSGRHILGHVEDGKMLLEEVYRFDNIQIRKNGHNCWDTDELVRHVIRGIKKCAELGKTPVTLGIDTWGVDYVLLDKSGGPVCGAVAYRDERTAGMKEEFDKIMPFEILYEKTGIQYQPFNTVYQLLSHVKSSPGDFERAERFLMIPDYLNYVLTGVMTNEYTNATTTALVNAKSKSWDWDVIDALGVPRRIFGEVKMPSDTVGSLRREIADEAGLDCTVVLPATHDTGSAFMAVPAKNSQSVYISSGTWSLLGVENSHPITNADSLAANFTNEGGYGGRFRYLKNIMGLWMIQSIRRELNGQAYVKNKEMRTSAGKKYSFAELETEARSCEGFTSVIDVDKEVFLSPESMIEAVKGECEKSGQQIPKSTGEVLQCVYKSLAKKYASAIEQLESLTGVKYSCINIVGGGSRDGYLSELTAKETGLPVLTGPTEGTALGNLMAQFIRLGEFESLDDARKTIYNSFMITEVRK